jgi:PAS domain S-box-containing protein
MRGIFLGMVGVFVLIVLIALVLRREFLAQTRNLRDAYARLYDDALEQQRAKEVLRGNLALLTTLIENLQMGVMVEDDAHRALHTNQELVRIFGGPAEMEAQRQARVAAARDDRSSRAERLLLTDGRVIERDHIAIEMGTHHNHLWLYRDITERERIQAALRRRDAILEAVSAAAESFLKAASWEESIEDVLAQLGEASGASRVYLGENHTDERGDMRVDLRWQWHASAGLSPMPVAQLPDLSYAEAGLARLRASLSQNSPVHDRAGDLLPGEREALSTPDVQELAVMPIFVGPEWWGLMGLDTHDPTIAWSVVEIETLRIAADMLGAAIHHQRAEVALHSSEDRYRHLVENMDDVILTTDLEGRLTYVSPVAERRFGYRPEELLGRTADQYIHPDDLALLDGSYKRAMRGRPEPIEVRILDAKGAFRYARIALRAVWEGGQLVGLNSTVTDMSERRALEEQLRLAQRMESIGRLAGGVAHDFNNILTAINGYSQLLLGEMDAADPHRADVEAIREAGVRATELTRQLLTFSRRQMMHPRVLDPNRSIEGLHSMLRRMIGEDIELVLALQGKVGHIKADASQLDQVLMNLIVNARDAMPRGGTITVRTTEVTLDEDQARAHAGLNAGVYVVLEVSDTGAGMSDTVKQYLFEPFFTTKERGKGTGLGLATVYGIVIQSGGNIFCQSELGHGTTFRLYFPRVDMPVEPPAEHGEMSQLPQGQETILLVEDEEAVRDVASQVLRRQGYHVLRAANGAEAWEVFTQHQEIDLLLSDIVMPQMGGLELAERVAASRPQVRILLMSGYADNPSTRLGLADLEVAFLPKPFSPAALARQVRLVLDKPRPIAAS